MRSVWVARLVVALLAPCPVWGQATFAPVVVDSVPSAVTYGYAMSGDGSAAVGGFSAGWTISAFLWQDGVGAVSMEPMLGNPIISEAKCISGDGSVVAGMTIGDQGQQVFRWSESLGVQTINGATSADGISPDGAFIVGGTTDGQAYRWSESTGLQPLGVLGGYATATATACTSDGSVVVGTSSGGANDFEAFYWTADGGMQTLYLSTVTDISSDGRFVIGTGEPPCGPIAYCLLMENGVLADFVSLQAPDSIHDEDAGYWGVPYDITADGSLIVGRAGGLYRATNANYRAVIWGSDRIQRDLQDLLERDYGLTLPGWQLAEARGVSDDGQTMVGWGFNPQGQRQAWIVQLPEPTTATLLAFGLMAVSRRRTRHRAAS